MEEQDRRGILYPQRLPEFHRLAPPPALAHAVHWFWIPEWSLPRGAESRQELLPYPACNLVVEPAGTTAVGPTTRRSERVLTGSGWAVGALLRPAAVPALVPDPARCRDAERPVPDAALLEEVTRAMADPEAPGDARRARAVEVLSRWLLERVPQPGADGALANELAEAIADPAVTRADQLPALLHASARTLQRLAERFFGLSLHSMIRRRRLQEGAQRLREDAGLGIAALASELGYADHAHFTSDFKALLGVTPSEYRARAQM
ncbi:helix-turn-helix domain-containing protein [Leucobacter sp. wl10]|uniref:helix-turn-helix domain-containing protein n=1 Tax=Leucobacter sp. wl10 TaxID=2304677 RepID=UPI000E5C475A|nr:helix-turn-helix domain-containing protein [Leucobacter sp. wl10]RGE21884.1 AraC family transcriptional regulator [Leucobacter sp. wl10]